MNALPILLFAAASLSGSEGPPPVLQPTTYASPSGSVEFFVDPTERQGGGEGHYTMTHEGQVVWKATHPVTLWEAVVTDAGYAAGYGYSKGYRDYRSEGRLHLMLFDPEGKLLLDEATQREPSPFMHSAPVPLAGLLCASDDQDLMRVRVVGGERPATLTWRTYRLSTGERLEDWTAGTPLELNRQRVLYPVEVHSLPGTDLTLMHWWHVEFRKWMGAYPAGGVFSLVDGAGQEVWSLERLKDYTVGGDEAASRVLERRVRKDGAILGTGSRAAFELWFPSDKARVSFSARDTGDGWVVTRGEERSFAPLEVSVPETPTLELPLLGSTLLVVPAPVETAIRDIRGFGFADGGALEFTRGGEIGLEYVQLTKAGDVERVVPIDDFVAEGGTARWHDGGGDLWFAAVKFWGEDPHTELFRVDVQTGRSRPWGGLPCPSIDRLVPLNGGGFVLLGTFGSGNGSTDAVVAVDASGLETWRVVQDYRRTDEPGVLFSPKDLAVTVDGTVVVLDVVRDTLQLYSSAGEYQRTVELEEAWGHKPSYPARILSDARGNVWVVDDEQLWRTSLDGELLEVRRPDFPERSPFPIWATCAGPHGSLWSTDRSMLMSLAQDGSPGPFIGNAPSSASIEKPDSAWIDRRGLLFVQDERSKAWHMFDRGGQHLQVYELPEDVAHDDGVRPRPAIGPQGEVYVPLESGMHFRFQENGDAVGQTRFGFDCVQFVGGGAEHWCFESYKEVLVPLGGDGRASELKRRPDGQWWSDVSDFHVSADGSRLAVLDAGPTLCLFDTQGRGQFLLGLPRVRASRVAVSNRFAVVSDFRDDVLLIDLEQRSSHKLDLEESPSRLKWGFSPDGTELWAIDGSPLRLRRYALPKTD